MTREMRTWEHLGDAGKVGLANSLAIITSFQTELEWWLRFAVLAVTGIYTTLKIVAHVRGQKGKNDE